MGTRVKINVLLFPFSCALCGKLLREGVCSTWLSELLWELLGGTVRSYPYLTGISILTTCVGSLYMSKFRVTALENFIPGKENTSILMLFFHR